MIKWIQIQVQSEIDLVEALHEIFYKNGFSHIHITRIFKKDKKDWFEIVTYIPEDDKAEQRKTKLEQDLWHIQAFDLGQIAPVLYSHIDSSDLAHHTQAEPGMHWVTPDIVVKPAYLDVIIPPNKIVIELAASSAFGTGLHPSTALCIRALQKHLKPHMHMLDIGSGTGILSLVAAKLETDKVTAIEISQKDYEATVANIQLNNLEQQITPLHASISEVDELYDLVVANLPASLLDRHARYIYRTIKPLGLLIISGLQKQQYTAIQRRFTQYSLEKIDEIRDNEWISLIFKKSQ